MDLNAQRRFYAEEIQATSNLTSAAVVEALATVPRERFLRQGPWTIRGEADFQASPRRTIDADPRHVYHNVAIAIDPQRHLFNGAPGILALAIDALMLERGNRVLHIGPGTGYYTALMAEIVGPEGRVVAIEVDDELALEARANLASMPWVDVRHGDGRSAPGGIFDAILVNAGVTHPVREWLDALTPGGRMILPLTAGFAPAFPIGKGLLLLLTRTTDPDVLDCRVLTFVAIYSAIGLRDETINRELGLALRANMMPRLAHLRLDPHDRTERCWLHTESGCFSTALS